MTDPAFTLLTPNTRTTSVIFASPHSGRDYFPDFLNRASINEQSIRSSEDAFVDDLFSGVVGQGAPFLAAVAPRAYLDLNRAPDELDPALIQGVRRASHNPRIASGLGVIPRVVSNGRPIYEGKLSLSEAHARIRTYWRPYHDMLQTLIDQSHAKFGESVLIDCHSMPHEALESIGSTGGARPDVVLGDRFGAAASSSVVEQVEAAFASAGFKVARNMPFAGAYVCQHYGRPSRRQHAIQVEIDRSLYMNEATIEPSADFADFKNTLDAVIAQLVEIGRPATQRMAAE